MKNLSDYFFVLKESSANLNNLEFCKSYSYDYYIRSVLSDETKEFIMDNCNFTNIITNEYYSGFFVDSSSI